MRQLIVDLYISPSSAWSDTGVDRQKSKHVVYISKFNARVQALAWAGRNNAAVHRKSEWTNTGQSKIGFESYHTALYFN